MFARSWHQLILCTVLLLSHPILSLAADFTFSWLPNTEPNLAGYKIHYGTASNSYATTRDVGLATLVNGRVTATVTGLTQGGTYYFVATAYDSTGMESGYSNEVVCLVTATNGAPTAQSSSFTVEELKSYNGRLSGSDPDQDPLSFTLATPPQFGTLSLNPDGSFVYTASTNPGGTDCFSFTVSDGKDVSAPAAVSITVSPSAPLPVAPPANGLPTAQSSSFTVEELKSYEGRLTGSDPNQDSLSFTLAAPPQHGSLFLHPDGFFVYTASSASNGSTDSFSFTVSDGKDVSAPATVSITVSPAVPLPVEAPPSELHLEAGEVNINHKPARITFAQQFSQPVVVANLITRKGTEPCVLRISNVDSTGFTVRVQEYDYLDNIHVLETISYVVMEKGTYTLNDGTLVEAGTFETNATTAHAPQTLRQAMNTRPVIMTSIVTANEAQAVTGRLRNISTKGFDYLLQEQERNAKSHATETVAYIAWEPGSGVHNGMRYAVQATTSSITNKSKTIGFGQTFAAKPFIFGDMQTTNEIDTSILRITKTATNGVTVFVEEEKSMDREITHGNEQGGFLVLMTE